MVLIEITPEGQAILEEISRQLVSQIQKLLDPLSAADEVALQAGLAVLQTIFDGIPPPLFSGEHS